MGVYIKGMEMPKCCAECDAEGHYENSYGDEYGFFCPFGYKAYTEETREAKRLDNCPLVPVPPHGRLIDYSWGYAPTITPAEEVYGQYTDTAGNYHWCGTHSGEHKIKAEEGE